MSGRHQVPGHNLWYTFSAGRYAGYKIQPASFFSWVGNNNFGWMPRCPRLALHQFF